MKLVPSLSLLPLSYHHLPSHHAILVLPIPQHQDVFPNSNQSESNQTKLFKIPVEKLLDLHLHLFVLRRDALQSMQGIETFLGKRPQAKT